MSAGARRARSATSVAASVTTRIRGGRVVTPSGVVDGDVFVEDGRISAIGNVREDTECDVELDAAGCFVLPGGVDAHVHLMEDLAAGTRAAVLGGTTTVLSFTNPGEGEGALEGLLRCRREVEQGRPSTDVGLHAMLYEPDAVSVAELLALRDAGASAVKVFLAYRELGIMWSTQGLYRLMKAARTTGHVVQVHCETGPLIDCLIEDALEAHRFSARSFIETRPPAVEADSVATVVAISEMTGTPSYLVHLSSAEAVELVRLAKRRSVGTMAETCVHYLVLQDDAYDREDATRFLVAPPLRSGNDSLELWQGMADGTIDTVGSDHCQVKSPALHELSESGDGYLYGLAGVGARLPILLSEGLRRGIPIERLVEVGSSAPARLFGHFPAKGALVAGSDADIVVFDPSGSRTLDESAFPDGTGPSVYAGVNVHGSLRFVMVRGEVAVRDDQHVPHRLGPGRYLAARPRGLSS